MRRGLTPEEAALWEKVATTVAPLHPRRALHAPRDAALPPAPARAPVLPQSKAAPRPAPASARPQPVNQTTGLDSTWERKIARGTLQPDFTLDLHGATLDAAHGRLDHGLTQALAQGARVVLLVTGRPRPADGEHGRGERRGAIRAKFADWLAAGPHANRIAAIRPAHPRHGGHGAVYIVLRRSR